MKRLIIFSLLFQSLCAVCQVSENINVDKISEKIELDGVLDENAWKNAKIYAKDFYQYFPTDSLQAKEQTTIKMAFDDQNLYIAVECFTLSKDFVVPSLKRDYRASGNDNITLLIDPFNDGINAFMFGTNPAGVQREGLISGGGTSLRGFTTSWDNKWKCQTKYMKTSTLLK